MPPNLNPYPSYKPSGIPWLGDVPEHWVVERLSSSVESQINGVWGSDPDGTDDLPCIRVADFDRRNHRIRTGKLTLRSVKRSERSGRILRKGDLLLEKSGGGEKQPVGTVMLYDHDFQAVCSNFVGRMVLRESYDPTYQTYLHATLYAIGVNKRSIKQTTGIQNIDASSYLSELVGVPPPNEQRAIVRYLDYVDRRIRRYVSAKRRLIALLEEEKQAVVTRAVTRGLDPNVSLKSSGVEWLGDVPEHWEVRRLGRIADSFRTGPFGSILHQSDYVEDGTPVINPVHMMNGSIVEDSSCSVSEVVADRLSSYRLGAHDLVFSRRGELGRCALVRGRETGWLCGTGTIRVRVEYKDIEPEFLIQSLRVRWVGEYLSLVSVGATMDNLNTAILKGIPIVVPPIQQQRDLLEHIGQQSRNIDSELPGPAVKSSWSRSTAPSSSPTL